MTRVKRSARPPAVLKTRGKDKRRGICSTFTRFERDICNGVRELRFDSSIYGHPTVKQALRQAQFGKCAFCESKIGHVAYGDVEHFRPKAGFQQSPSDPLTKPGYYWLAYEWSNLLLSCQICNQRYKRNLFPLQAPDDRARSHRDDVDRERPLLIDPSTTDPEPHIAFRCEVAYAVDDSALGKTTIEALGLNREELSERRMELLAKLEALYRIANRKPPIPASTEAQTFLDRAVQGSAEYAAMARSALASKFEWDE